MVLIPVPKPPESAYNPDRPMGSLLRSQVEHLREAESKLPLRYRHEIETYVKAVRTEGEAARYIRAVTEAIHLAHEDAERDRSAPKPRPGPGPVIEVAAVAGERTQRVEKPARKRPAAKSKKRAHTKRRRK